jgi:predicted CXXCH cytochrome family protein
MKWKILLFIPVLWLGLWALQAGAGLTPGTGIVHSKHDMNDVSNPDTQTRVCAFCHTPHHALDDMQADYLPLWSHELTQMTFGHYETVTFDGRGAPASSDRLTGPSRLCMSCHDGAVAVDQHYGIPGSDIRPGDSWGDIGVGAAVDLTNDHPIGFDYTQVADVDFEIKPETTAVSNPKVDIIQDLLYDDDGNGDATIMTCSSCHDVHNTDANDDYFLYNYQANSEFCLTCHDK